jgi:hypothetical protein
MSSATRKSAIPFRRLPPICLLRGGGAFTELVLDSIFGMELTMSDGIKVNLHLVGFDPTARLKGLRY